MRLLILVSIFVACASAYHVEIASPQGYHEEVGIPLASQIKKYEDELRTDIEGKIVGGAIAPAYTYPYLAGLLITFVNIGGTSVCGSSLISNNRLVTAAHCWFDGRNQANQFTVVVGTQWLYSGGQRIATRDVVPHPQWNFSNLNNDVAVIKLPYRINFSPTIQPVTLPSPNQLAETFVGQWATAAGYGITTDSQVGASTTLSHVNLQVISVAQCQRTFGSNYVVFSTLCTSGAGGVGVCKGDSGGPLVVNRNGDNILVGISSFVAQNQCMAGHPSAFARVTSFYSFILSHYSS